MRLVFEPATDLRYDRKGYRAVLVSTYHEEGDEPRRVVLAEITDGWWSLPTRSRRREIDWSVAMMRMRNGELVRTDYTDTLAAAKQLVEDRLVWLLAKGGLGEEGQP